MPLSTPVAVISLLEGVGYCTPSGIVPESLVVSTVPAVLAAEGRGRDVVCTASVSVSGMRGLSGSAAGEDCHMALQIVNPLQQVSGVGGLGD